MPRKKPIFSDYEYLFDGLKILVPENLVINTPIKIFCKHGHEYVLTVANILKYNKDPKTCPHCLNEEKYNQGRIPYSFFEQYAEKYNFEVKNKKDYYRKEDDEVVFVCKKCGKYEEKILALRYFFTNYKNRQLVCEECIKEQKGLKTQKDFESIINQIEYRQDIKEMNAVIDYGILPDALKEKIQGQNKWNLIEYTNIKNKAKYQCRDCGYIKITYPYTIFVDKKSFNCRNCFVIQERKRIYEEMRLICKTNEIFPVDVNFYKSAVSNILFKCNKCGNEFVKKWKDKSYGFSCTECNIKSKTETHFADYISSIYNEEVIRNDREQIKPYELDIYLPTKKIAFEYCGGIWHSTKYNSDKLRHRNKYELCEKKGIRLVTIFEDEWVDKTDICKSRIKNLLNIINKKIYARLCEVKQISNSDALKFCNNYHIQGKGSISEAYGLFHEESLVSVMTFSKPSVSKNGGRDYEWEMSRFCSINDIVVVGGANKLLSCFSDKHKGEQIVSFCDLRWGNGKVYEHLGFEYKYRTRPNYYYIGPHTKWKRKHRFNYTKQRLITLFNEDKNLTEEEIANKQGLYRIYDCGHLKFQKQL